MKKCKWILIVVAMICVMPLVSCNSNRNSQASDKDIYATIMEKNPDLLNIAKDREVHIIACEIHLDTFTYAVLLDSVEHITWETWFNDCKRLEEDEVKYILSYNKITEDRVTLHPYIIPYSDSHMPPGEVSNSRLSKRFDGKYKIETGFKVY